jgi:uncharacterized protein YrrD/ElaB/YqjD/DUF883 family membrane-anchored ribosome-binding protein
MSSSADAVLRHRQLYDRLVIDLDTTEELGRMAHLVVDVRTHQVEGLVCKTGLLGHERLPIPWVNIEAIGVDSIVVKRDSAAVSERFDAALPMDGQELWTDVGNRVGRVVDFCFDRQTGAISQYLFTAPGWQGLTDGVYLFQPDVVVSAGRKRVMVRHQALADAPQYSAGLPDRATDFLQDDASQTRQDLQTVVDRTQDIAGQVQTQAQKLGEEAKSRFGKLLGQVKQRSKRVRSEVNDRFADAASTLEERRQGRRGDRISGTTIDVDSEEVWPEDRDTPGPTP